MLGRGCRIDAELARILVGRAEGEHAIAQPALLAHFLEQPRGHAAAQNTGQHLQDVDVGVAVAGAGKDRTTWAWSSGLASVRADRR